MPIQFTPSSGTNKLIPGQVYDLANPGVLLAGGSKIIGAQDATQPPSIINCAPSANGEAFHINNDGVEIHGVRLVGGGIHLDKSGSRNANIVLDNIEFLTDVSMTKPHKAGINFTVGLKNSRITNCLFKPKSASFGIYGYNYDDLIIANNEFVGIGMHIDCQGGGKNLLVEQNYLVRVVNMGMEFQTTGNAGVTGAVFQDNWFEDPDVTKAGKDSMAYSLPMDKSQGMVIRRNYAKSALKSGAGSGQYTRIMFELGGFDLLCEDNYSYGGNDVCAVNGSNATGKVRNNHFEAYDHMGGNNGANHANAVFTGNSSTLAISWLARGRPFRNKRFGGVVTPPPPGPPPTDPKDKQIADLQSALALCNQRYADLTTTNGALIVRITKKDDFAQKILDTK